MKGLTEGLDQTCEVNFWPSLSSCVNIENIKEFQRDIELCCVFVSVCCHLLSTELCLFASANDSVSFVSAAPGSNNTVPRRQH